VLVSTHSGRYCEEIHGPNSSHKTGSIKEGLPLFINMPKILSTSNVGLFLNTLPHVQANIFSGPYHRVSSVGLFVMWYALIL
jgi:hypothetical protein